MENTSGASVPNQNHPRSKRIPYEIVAVAGGILAIALIILYSVGEKADDYLLDGACVDVRVQQIDSTNSVAVRGAEFLDADSRITNFDDVTAQAGEINPRHKFVDRVCITPERDRISYINGVRLRK